MTDKKLCRKCSYRGTLGGVICCDYAWVTGRCRTALPKREDGRCPGFDEGPAKHVEFVWPVNQPLTVTRVRAMKYDGKKMMELYNQGMTDGQIAEAVGSSKSAVYGWRKRNDLKPNVEPPQRTPRFSRKLFRLLYEQGLSDAKIARRMKCGVTSVGRWRRQIGLPPNGKPFWSPGKGKTNA